MAVDCTTPGAIANNPVVVVAVGSLNISSTPLGATIYIDNSLVDPASVAYGITNKTIANIAIGTHTIKLTYVGYQDYTATGVVINDGATTTVNYTMTLLTGSLSISSTPSGASVYIDGNGTASGVTPLTVTDFTPGTHTYRLTLTGYTEIPATNFTITAGQTTTVSETMLTVASIVAQSITVTPSNPCIEGTCSVSVSATWVNNGQTAGTFTPNISIDGTPATPVPAYVNTPIGASPATVTKTFVITGLTAQGSPHSICPIPNI